MSIWTYILAFRLLLGWVVWCLSGLMCMAGCIRDESCRSNIYMDFVVRQAMA